MHRPPGTLRQLARAWAPGAAALVLVAGCGGRTGDLAGKVTFKDKALHQGTVSVAAADGSILNAVIQDDGSYSLAGVPVGEAKVGVNSPDPRSVKVAQRKKDEKAPPPDTSKWFPIPEKYADTRQSGLTTDVKPGKNPFDIDLK
jgi:hypothetical protein